MNEVFKCLKKKKFPFFNLVMVPVFGYFKKIEKITFWTFWINIRFSDKLGDQKN